MAEELVVGYLLAWALTTLGLIISSRWLGSRGRPAPHPVAVSLLAGAAWPFLLLGLIEMGAVAAAFEVIPDDHPGINVIA